MSYFIKIIDLFRKLNIGFHTSCDYLSYNSKNF